MSTEPIGRGASAMLRTMPARRKVLEASLAVMTTMLFHQAVRAAGMLPSTPAQTAGPFFPVTFPQDSDNDLVHVAGHSQPATGTTLRIDGRILDPNGKPVRGARVEIWQCDANGRYHHVRDDRSARPRDENFQGYGATTTDAAGTYQFLTIKPVPYPGRTPHIHFAVASPGVERFVTQMYVAGEPGNDRDPVLMGIGDPAARARLVVALRPAIEIAAGGLAGRFDVVIGGVE